VKISLGVIITILDYSYSKLIFQTVFKIFVIVSREDFALNNIVSICRDITAIFISNIVVSKPQ